MIRLTLIIAMASTMLLGWAGFQTREEKVRNDKAKIEAGGYWIYNDFAKAQSEAKKTGKPLIAVMRCIPCVECVKLDDDLIDADARVKPLLDQFVRVRIISTNGLDLSVFQFDTDQSFAAFLLNADGTIYGRFGTRSHRTVWENDVSVDGLVNALQRTLAIHKQHPKYKTAFAAKRGPVPEFIHPELLPSLKDKYKSTIDYEGKVVQSCIHCHQVGDAVRELSFSRKEKLPEKLLFPYPHPKSIGLILDPNEIAMVRKAEPGSAAARAGFKTGDEISVLEGQPLLSIADVQWVLNGASADGANLKATVVRGDKIVDLTLKLDKGWRQRDDISWRASTWGLRRKALGGMLLEQLPVKDRTEQNLPSNSTALMVKHVGEFAPHNVAHRAGIRKGDIVLGFDSRTDLLRETDVIAYSLREKQPGDRVEVSILRNGSRQTVSFVIPES